MASAVYSEPPASRLSIALEGEASVSPFPSPSSSFLPPPTPGAHEFAVKPAPAARNSRKLSTTAHITTTPAVTTPTVNGDAAAATPTAPHAGPEPSSQRLSTSGVQAPALAVNGLPQLPVASPSPLLSPSPSANGASTISTTKQSPGLDAGIPPSSPSMLSPTTPTPYTMQHQTGSSSSTLEPPRSPGAEGSTSSSTTPTIQTLALPPEDAPIPDTADPLIPHTTIPTTPTTATTKSRPRQEDEYPAKIIIPSNLDAGLMSLNGASSPSSPAFSTFSNTSRSRPLSTSFASPADPASSTSASSPSLFSNRPAPPSPALSRRVSGVPSLSSASTRSKPSRPPSQVVSRANSLRKSTSGAGAASPMMHPHRLSQSFAPPSPLPSPASPAFALSVSGPPPGDAHAQPAASTSASAAHVLAPTAPAAARSACIRVRDFGFPASDERHRGLGPDVPRANTVARLNRRLGAPRAHSVGGSSAASSDDGREDDGEDEDGEWGDADGGWGSSSVFGTLRWAYPGTAGAGGAGAGAEGSGFPSQGDLDQNFRAEEEWDDEGGGGGVLADEQEDEDEDTLYPGLYRALYAFEPEGTAEMRLVEDQVVRVVGRGGGVGWAVVVDESADADVEGEVRHALVPESYLEPVRLDWEDEEAAATVGAGANAMEVTTV
ncbi:hypothetical protein BJ912DRAFT_1152216 [Pholiota molesta]|nr:hypothetical protein BJ912DRAFT_1152216 [Pholiota molesta]